jgi:hypothetical protein
VSPGEDLVQDPRPVEDAHVNTVLVGERVLRLCSLLVGNCLVTYEEDLRVAATRLGDLLHI